jgi:hypothetical protein
LDFATKERLHGEEGKKESESEKEKVIFRIGVKLSLMPICLETVVGTSAAGNIPAAFYRDQAIDRTVFPQAIR